jgi:hypothetical protein
MDPIPLQSRQFAVEFAVLLTAERSISNRGFNRATTGHAMFVREDNQFFRNSLAAFHAATSPGFFFPLFSFRVNQNFVEGRGKDVSCQ